MKKLAIYLFVAAISLTLFGCGKAAVEQTAEEPVGMLEYPQDERAEKAINVLKGKWDELYSQNTASDGYLEIRSTRVIDIDERTDVQEFKDIECIVEFSLLSDYFGTAPVYMDAGVYNCVVIYRNGSSEVAAQHPLNVYRARTYSTDLSGIVDRVKDMGSSCNQIFDLVK